MSEEKKDPKTIEFERHVGSDYEQRKGKYVRQVWETSGARSQGYFKWGVYYYSEDLERWVQVAGSIGYFTKDIALTQSERAFTEAIEHNIGANFMEEE